MHKVAYSFTVQRKITKFSNPSIFALHLRAFCESLSTNRSIVWSTMLVRSAYLAEIQELRRDMVRFSTAKCHHVPTGLVVPSHRFRCCSKSAISCGGIFMESSVTGVSLHPYGRDKRKKYAVLIIQINHRIVTHPTTGTIRPVSVRPASDSRLAKLYSTNFQPRLSGWEFLHVFAKIQGRFDSPRTKNYQKPREIHYDSPKHHPHILGTSPPCCSRNSCQNDTFFVTDKGRVSKNVVLLWLKRFTLALAL